MCRLIKTLCNLRVSWVYHFKMNYWKHLRTRIVRVIINFNFQLEMKRLLRIRDAKIESQSNSNSGLGLRKDLSPPIPSSPPLFVSQTSLLCVCFSVKARCRVAAALTSQSPPRLVSFIVKAGVGFCLVHRWQTTWNYGDHPGLWPTTALFVCR